MPWRKRKVGLALGSGGARGWAHLGVLRALRERNMAVECVAGSSMGALVGAFFAANRLSALEEVAFHLDWNLLRRFFWEISLSRSGLTDGRRLLVEAQKLLEVREFRALGLPFRAVATDLENGGEVVLQRGELMPAIRASISIPGLFSPVWLQQRLLVDGGLVDPVPVHVVREMGARHVIAVDVSQGGGLHAPKSLEKEPVVPPPNAPPLLPKHQAAEELAGVGPMLERFLSKMEQHMRRLSHSHETAQPRPSMMDILIRSVRISEAQLAMLRRKMDPPDLLIEVPVGGIGTLEFHRAREVADLGYRAACEVLDRA